MPKPVALPPAIQKATAIFATLLIVVGIAAVAYVSSEKKPETSSAPTPAGEAPPHAGLTGPRLLLQSDHALTVMTLDGRTERYETVDAFQSQYASQRIRIHGTEAATGAGAIFATTTDAIRSGTVAPTRRMSVVLGEAQADGAGVLVVTSEDGETKRVIARTKDGKALRVGAIAGWLDDETIAVDGSNAEGRVLAEVPLNGSATILRSLAENVLFVYARDGFAWLMTGVQGEGLETPPFGPSELIRVAKSGAEIPVARDELRVISSVVSGKDDRTAYTTDDGQSFVMIATDPSSKAALGSRRPLQFMPDGKLLIRDGFDLALYDLSTGVSTKIGSLPEGLIRVFLFEEAS